MSIFSRFSLKFRQIGRSSTIAQYIFDQHLITVISGLSGEDLDVLKKILGLSSPGLYLVLLEQTSNLCL